MQPSDTVVGDLLIAQGLIDTSSSLTVALAGFNALPRSTTNTGGVTQVWVNGAERFMFAVFWLVATLAGTQNYAATWGGGSLYNAWSISTIRAGTFDPANPIADSSLTGVTVASTSLVLPSISPAMAGCMDVLTAGIDNTGTGTPPGGYTERVDNTIGSYTATSTADLGSAGSTGTATVTLSASRVHGLGRIAVAPVSAAAAASRLGLLGVG